MQSFTAESAASTAAIPHPLSSATRSDLTTYPAHRSEYPSQDLQQHRLLLAKEGNNNELIKRVISSDFVKVYEHTFILQDAKDYLYAESTKHRILKWQDITVNILI